MRGANLSITFTPPLLPAPDWIDERVETILYRVVQETLTNVVRHAQASNVTVAVELDAQQATVHITDDGVGMGTAVEGNGIGGMRERLGAQGGTLEIFTARGAGNRILGTNVRALIPAPVSWHA